MPILSDEDYYFLKTYNLRLDNEGYMAVPDFQELARIETKCTIATGKWLYHVDGYETARRKVRIMIDTEALLFKDYEDANTE